MSWVRNAFVGQRVICVDTINFHVRVKNDSQKNLNGLKTGEIYTVREVYICPVWGIESIRINEIVRPFDHIGYGAFRFKPLDESRLDVFRAMLVEKPQHADA